MTSLRRTIGVLILLALASPIIARLLTPAPFQEGPQSPAVDTPPVVVAEDAEVTETPEMRLQGVVATVYHAVPGQTDDTPFQTADGTRIDPARVESGEQRFIAVSRDLLTRWGGPIAYGDKVRVRGAGRFDGDWIVRDTMNRRYGKESPVYDYGVRGIVEPHALPAHSVDGFHHIDFLVPVSSQLGKWHGVEVFLF